LSPTPPYHRLIEGAQFDGEETEQLRRQSVLRTEVLPSLAHTVIREAKSSGLLPAQVMDLAQSLEPQSMPGDVEDYDMLTIAAGLYDRYQALLQERGWIDYDDMILAALRTLADPDSRAFGSPAPLRCLKTKPRILPPCKRGC
jgi:DNA helicase II / ATP-dependent DNA helicase PcrA